MPEAGGSNIEIAHKLCEKNGNDEPKASRMEFTIEILEAVILAFVAVATAWSGYQAAQWDGHEAELFAEANILNIEASTLITASGQEIIYNTNTFNAWINAKMQGNKKVAEFYERRFLDWYKPAFDSWIKTDPINNSEAPRGPMYMPEFRNPKMEEAVNLTRQAEIKFSEGTKARAIADDYVRTTVFLATILVLTAISQRFYIKSIRTGLIILSVGLLIFGLLSLIMLPRY